VDRSLGADAASALAREAHTVARRIVLLTPAERHELADLKAAGFAGYLVKPLRAASLAARFRDDTPVEAAIADHRAGEGVGAARAEGLSILVAEDNEINALLARALLHRLGHRTTIAPNGAAALETFCAALSAGKPYDLVLMDVHMP